MCRVGCKYCGEEHEGNVCSSCGAPLAICGAPAGQMTLSDVEHEFLKDPSIKSLDHIVRTLCDDEAHLFWCQISEEHTDICMQWAMESKNNRLMLIRLRVAGLKRGRRQYA